MTAESATNNPTPAPVVPVVVWQLLALAWASVILFLSLTPSPPQPPGFLGWDKLQHAGAYGLLALLFACCLRTWFGATAVYACRIAWAVATAFGAMLELLQMFAHSGRSAEWGDLAADAVGALLACVVFRLASAARSRRNRVAEEPHG